jgi:cyclic beta-1,2-glucan synthetase
MNYQYRAFGIPSLGLHRGLENDLVISPYSSFLSLCVSSKGVIDNLEVLKRNGMYGKYGFFEAADFTKRRVKTGFAKVKSVMSHHAGMSMAACANACFDNILQRHFMGNARMSAAEEFLEEKIPVDAAVKTRRPARERVSLPSTRNEGASRIFENVGNIIASSFGQLVSQRSIAEIPKKLMKSSIRATKTGQTMALSYMAMTSAKDTYASFKEAGAED